ncbi:MULTISPECIES: DeoR/GlpR family DNA-binding transcription regulator [Actinopolyspora]|uniref:DNA-binding transcriptional regulator of sugar metabolism, DeoR/GlpR family n=1 Tax=Actinopolyspora saharensis TaxID=995062 RepID=A0A1H1EJM0_9ACTN|nr:MULTISPECIES: DeoR/GlpR family DNA-binding transcription regulator [Actinopolyspora]NHD19125.1 DeoR/GlpR transcriptional regulator [Actinopolyspora sp. BKK2]NHE78090.1 DeoR/GlpR transcriptional regulator [Actinopolyspora sp. BKK1]SDQ88923.1 DNA-binding transcriptional regulator of sugar metabolism, DeoR/GlpR family [Actinopolyspora saharensis]
MLARQRQDMILDEVRRTGAVQVSDLVQRLGVSDMTIRRDLDTLAARGEVEKVYGGATSVLDRSTDEPGFEAKSVYQPAEKKAIALRAAEMIRPGTALGLSAGTTTWTLARHLDDVADLTVVTNSVRIADVLQQRGRTDRTVILTGGVRTPSDALVGPVAVRALQSLHLDVVFLGVHGMSTRAGFTTPNLDESETNRALARTGNRLVVLADHAKWSTVGISTIVGLDEADVLVTDDGLPEEARATLNEHVSELAIAPVAAADGASTGSSEETNPKEDDEK